MQIRHLRRLITDVAMYKFSKVIVVVTSLSLSSSVSVVFIELPDREKRPECLRWTMLPLISNVRAFFSV